MLVFKWGCTIFGLSLVFMNLAHSWQVLHSHGAVSLSPPLLVPCGTTPLPPSGVSVMTRWGGVAMLPHDLRLPFARFLGHNPSVTQCKRYAIDRVYRERRVLGHHPRELYECAFDIVTPPSGALLYRQNIMRNSGHLSKGS